MAVDPNAPKFEFNFNFSFDPNAATPAPAAAATEAAPTPAPAPTAAPVQVAPEPAKHTPADTKSGAVSEPIPVASASGGASDIDLAPFRARRLLEVSDISELACTCVVCFSRA